MLINRRNGMMAGRRSPLPPGARWVEYLESTGTQWIELGFLVNASKLQIKTRAVATSGAEQDLVSNQDNATNRFVLGFLENTCFAYSKQVAVNDGNASVGSLVTGDAIDIDCLYDTALNSKTLTVNGVSDTVAKCTNISNANKPVTLFRNPYDNTNYYKGKTWYVKIYKDGVLWYDLIPVRVGTTGYLYDRVSGALFGNQGTGAFSYGNDLPLETLAN